MRVGIDVDSWKLTACAYDGMIAKFEQEKIRQRGMDLFDAIQGVPAALAFIVARLGVEVEEVYIERGRGMFRTADFELGATYGATIIGIKRLLPNAHVASVTVAEWKKLVTGHTGIATKKGVPGNANAPKAVANESCRILLQRLGWTTTQAGDLSPDELDAFGIVWSVGQEPPSRQAKAQGQLAGL
jgi:hypothetical protein